MNIQLIENQILAANERTPVEEIADVLGKLATMKARIKELEATLEGKMIERIEATGEDIVIGAIRYYVGDDKKTTCNSISETIETILDVGGGDVMLLADCLCSEPFKYGTVRKVLEQAQKPDRFGELFTITVKPALREGKPVKRLQKINMEFVK